MSDDADRADEQMRRALDNALRHRKPTLPRVGHCHFCGESCAELFCDVDCRDDYEKRTRNQ